MAQRQPQFLALSRERCPCSQHTANRIHRSVSDGWWCKGWMVVIMLGHGTVLQTQSKRSKRKREKESSAQGERMKALRRGAGSAWAGGCRSHRSKISLVAVEDRGRIFMLTWGSLSPPDSCSGTELVQVWSWLYCRCGWQTQGWCFGVPAGLCLMPHDTTPLETPALSSSALC